MQQARRGGRERSLSERVWPVGPGIRLTISTSPFLGALETAVRTY